MEAVGSIQSFSVSQYRFQTSPVRRASEQEQPLNGRVEPVLSGLLDNVPIDQLPTGLTQEISSIFRRLNIYALQSAELGQSYANREALQENASEDLTYLKSVLEKLAQDELTLFIAIIQNSLQDGLVSSGGDTNAFDTDVFSNGFTNDGFESLFRIDVISERGTLAALDLTGTVIDILSQRDTYSGLLDPPFNDLIDLFQNFSILNNLVTDGGENTVSPVTNASENLEASQPEQEGQPTIETGSNPSTIIELAG